MKNKLNKSHENVWWTAVLFVVATGFFIGFDFGENSKYYLFGYMMGAMGGYLVTVFLEWSKQDE